MKIYFAVIAATILVSACNSGDHKHANHNAVTQVPATFDDDDTISLKPVYSKLDNEVSVHIQDIFNHYIQIKTALVASDAAEAKTRADALLKSLKSFDKSYLPADQKPAYDKSVSAIKTSVRNISATQNLEEQRAHFAILSAKAYELAKSFSAGKTLYLEHCSMALNDKGAMWLSESDEVTNPYYGDKMLSCGTIEEIIEL